MLKKSLLIFVLIIINLSSCKDPASPEEVVVGIGSLKTNPWDPNNYNISIVGDGEMNYGFDATESSKDVYVSLESGSSNSFLIKSNYWIYPQPEGLITDIKKGETVSDFTVRYTIYGDGTGSQKIPLTKLVYNEYVDIDQYAADLGETPKIYAKVYVNTILPTVNMYYMYGTATTFSNFKSDVNKICSQAVCTIQDFLSVSVKPAKPWDLNGNGKVDIYIDNTDTKDESEEVVEWAGPGIGNMNYWSNDDLAVLVLDQPIADHSGEGALGFRLQNCAILGSDADITTATHEYMHSPNVGSLSSGLRDVIDEFNLMNYGALGGQVLRYRSVTQYPSGTEPSQWQNLSNTSF